MKHAAVILLLFLSLALSGCAATGGKDVSQQRFGALMRVNDMNEQGFAYYTNCLAKTERINPVFLSNFKYVSNRLFDQVVASAGYTREKARDLILERRKSMQGSLATLYKAKGCQVPEAQSARQYYGELSGTKQDKIEDFLNSIK